jgi:hypothetical protein
MKPMYPPCTQFTQEAYAANGTKRPNPPGLLRDLADAQAPARSGSAEPQVCGQHTADFATAITDANPSSRPSSVVLTTRYYGKSAKFLADQIFDAYHR